MPRRRHRNAANNANGANNNANGANNNANRPNNNIREAGDAKLTPYQGSDKAFGLFKCQNCQRSWMSNNSWANYGQDCRKCKINVYPFAQFPLESEERKKKNKNDPKKPHDTEMCGKCKALGTNCVKFRSHRRRRRRRQSANE